MNKEKSVAIAFQNISKHFPPDILANDRVSFEIEKGTVHALLGENGAGKTTLMNILYGLYQADEGRIFVHNKPVHIDSPEKAISLGIGMVHQRFRLIQSGRVDENIILGLKSLPFFFPLAQAKEEIRKTANNYGFQVDPRAKIWQLSAGEQQRVEILKALYRKAEILILDEPTSVLTPGEAEELFRALRTMANDGKTIIFITHKLDEVMRVSDWVTVLRKGQVITTIDTIETNKEGLAQMMVGRKVIFEIEKKPTKRGRSILKVFGLSVLNDMGLPALKDVSLELAEGEILGIAGIAGNGQKELAEALTGLRQPLKGKIEVLNKDTTGASPRKIAQLGVAHIPEARQMGLVEPMTVMENLILRSYHLPPFSRMGWINQGLVKRQAEKLISEYEIVTPEASTPVVALSGGNRQRVILARELSGKPKIIIASHPTYGLDVGATEYIRSILLRERERGAGILLISEDLDEILALSDRIMVLFEGKVMATMERRKAKREKIGLLMAGIEAR